MLIKILLLIFDYYYYYYCYYVHSLQTQAGCSAWFVVLGSVQQAITLKKWFAPLTRGGGLKENSTTY